MASDNRKVNGVIWVAIGWFAVSAAVAAIAAPALPRYGVNDETMECSEFFMGDECVSCALPDGWKMIDGFSCPEAYTEDKARPKCIGLKNSFCCTMNHSGAPGDCDDVIVNSIEKTCAFVKDITKCAKLPANWNRAEKSDRWGRVCPSFEYEWREHYLECEKQ